MKICTGANFGDLIKFKFEEKKLEMLEAMEVKIRPFPLTLHVGLPALPSLPTTSIGTDDDFERFESVVDFRSPRISDV